MPTNLSSSARRALRARDLLPQLVLIAGMLTGAAAAHAEPAFVGTEVCAGCHVEEYTRWRGSHHDLAMQKPAADTVLGDFNDARFEHFGVETRFYRRDGRYYVHTDGPDGRLREYEVAWVFGVYPLQQYLLPLDNGRLQALSIAWDSRPAAEGGQRWYHLYPDEAIPHDDPLHWTGPYQNWNTRCAECHSTDVHKNYSPAERSFATTFFEDDVGCEACHGPGSEHLALIDSGKADNDPRSGLPTDLAARGEWYFPEGEPIAKRRTPLGDRKQIDNCARCHARRGTLGDYRYDRPLSDTHRLSLLGAPLYHHDGQILDEVYVYGSFLQSRMQQAGVVCANCHDPHSNRLRAEGNGVCAQCHRADVFDAATHHRHPMGSSGAQCVSCHMPSQVYMGVDARRDHSMRVPRPDLSITTGSPNACTQCHDDQTPSWALDALRDWGVNFSDSANHPAVAMAALQAGDRRAVPRLLELAATDSSPSIWRATALERAADAGARESVSLAQELLRANDPLLRISAVRAMRQLPPAQRSAVLAPLVDDPVSGVRLEVAAALAAVPLGQVSDGERETLLRLFDEYRAVQREHADMPSMQLQAAMFSIDRGDYPAAEAAYREALRINPQLLAARLNFADLLRSQGREEEAKNQLQQALATAPESGDAMHALGLLEARGGDREAALTWLGRAAAAEQQGSRHRFVYAVAQHDFGDPAAAIETLRRVHAQLPADEQVLTALVNYNAERGDLTAAKRYAEKLLALAPSNPGYQRMARQLGVRR